MKANDLLIPALRQYMHNDGSGLVFGYDKDEIDKTVGDLIERIESIEDAVMALLKEQCGKGTFRYRKVDDAMGINTSN